MAVPTETGVTVTALPDTETVATDGDDDDAPYVSTSPSGSRNAPDTSTDAAEPPSSRVTGVNTPAAAGGRLGGAPTVTANVCAADVLEPVRSVAVTVTVAVPTETGVTVTALPDTETVATDGDDDDAPYVSTSPSGSRNAPDTSTPAAEPPSSSVTGANAPTAAGGRLGGAPTVTANVCAADVFEPARSVAVTVTVAVPTETGVTVTALPDTETVATDGDDDDAPYVSTSPSGSRNAPDTSTAAADPPASSVTGANTPTASGGRFGLGRPVTASRSSLRCTALIGVTRPQGVVGVRRRSAAARPKRRGQGRAKLREVHRPHRRHPRNDLRVRP